MWSFLSAGAAPKALQPDVQQQEASTPPRTACLSARNFLNTQYTVSVRVGNAQFWMVPDSGSFEVLVPSASCADCRCVHSASRCCTEGEGRGADSKTTYAEPDGGAAGREVDITFGQGTVNGRLTREAVRVGALTAANQSVFLAQRHRVQGYCEGSYDGVLGLGHRRYARDGDDDTALLSTLGLNSFSICFGRHDDEPGRLVLGGGIPGLQYRPVPVVGVRHWAVQLVGVGFGAPTAACTAGKYCGAILDSGTSLLAGPRKEVQQLLAQLNRRVEEDCSNLHELPHLTLRLGSPDAPLDVELPPSLYVTRTPADEEGDDAPAFAASRLAAVQLARRDGAAPPEPPGAAAANATAAGAGGGAGRPAERCAVVFMELNMEDDRYGPVWILGMPFMRAYSALFSRAEAPAGAADPKPALTVSLAQIPPGTNPCAGCSTARVAPAAPGAVSLAAVRDDPGAPPAVSLRHARLPSWADGAGPVRL